MDIKAYITNIWHKHTKFDILYDRHDNGDISWETHYANGKKHRDGESAMIRWSKTKHKLYESWWTNGINYRYTIDSCHRPSYINYYPKGEIQALAWTDHKGPYRRYIELFADASATI